MPPARTPGGKNETIKGTAMVATERRKDKSTNAWADHADELASWAWQHMVNRTDVWGGYMPLNKRDKGKTTTRPAKAKRGKVLLTQVILAGHFRATKPEHVVGLHTTSPENTSRWGTAEIDWHDENSDAPAVNRAAAIGWYDKLVSYGFHPVLTDSNGRGGFHLDIIFAEPIPTARIFGFLRWLVSDHTVHGLPEPPETFPKQPRVDEHTPYGNWVRLPGLHHTRSYWSKVYNGHEFIEGAGAVEFILSLQGDPPTLITESMVMAPDEPSKPTPSTSNRQTSYGTDREKIVKRAGLTSPSVIRLSLASAAMTRPSTSPASWWLISVCQSTKRCRSWRNTTKGVNHSGLKASYCTSCKAPKNSLESAANWSTVIRLMNGTRQEHPAPVNTCPTPRMAGRTTTARTVAASTTSTATLRTRSRYT